MEPWDPSREEYVTWLIREHAERTAANDAAAAAPPASGLAADVAPSLMSDPAFAAFERALGSQRERAERQTQDEIDAANAGVPTRLAELGRAGELQRRQVGGHYASRGLSWSGDRERAMAEQREAQGGQESRLVAGTGQQVAGLRAALGERLAGFDTSLAEQRLASGQREQERADTLALEGAYSRLARGSDQPDDEVAKLLAELRAARRQVV